MSDKKSGNKVIKVVAGIIGAAAAVVAGAYLIGRLNGEQETDNEELKLIKLDNKNSKLPPEPLKAGKEKVEEVKTVAHKKVEKAEEELKAQKEEAKEFKEEFKAKRHLNEEKLPDDLEGEYPDLSNRKIESIRKQIASMIESMPDKKEVNLVHYVTFDNAEQAKLFAGLCQSEGYTVTNNNEQENELNLGKKSPLDQRVLERVILNLANRAAKDGGAYKGWAIKVN